eukprot:4208777-Amphidinium_carterae.1
MIRLPMASQSDFKTAAMSSGLVDLLGASWSCLESTLLCGGGCSKAGAEAWSCTGSSMTDCGKHWVKRGSR